MTAEKSTGGGAEAARTTRDQLIEAGLRAFGRCGYDGVSTRTLAELAGVNQAAIPYHFGGKEGLYLAVTRHLVEKKVGPIRQLADDILKRVNDEDIRDRDALLGLLQRLLDKFTDRLMHNNKSGDCIGSMMIREQLRPTAAFDEIYEGYLYPIHNVVAQLVARLENKPADHADTILMAHTLLGQMIFFGIARATVQRRMGWDDYSPERANHIARVVDDMRRRMFANDS